MSYSEGFATNTMGSYKTSKDYLSRARMHGELSVCSEKGPVFNEGKRTRLSSFFHGSVINKDYLEEALQQ